MGSNLKTSDFKEQNMPNNIKKVSIYTNEELQKIQFSTVLLIPIIVIVLLSVGVTVLMWVLYNDVITKIIPIIFAAIGIVFMIAITSSQRKWGEDFILRAQSLIRAEDSDGFKKLFDEIKPIFKRNKKIMRYILLKIYSYTIPIIAEDLVISDNEHKIIDLVKSYLVKYDKDKRLINEIHRFYLDRYMKVFRLSRFAKSAEGIAPYPEDEEKFIKSFFYVFEVSEEDSRIYLRAMEEKIIQQSLDLIEHQNTQALIWFLDEREKTWGAFNYFMREILFGIYSSMIPIIADDDIIDAEEQKMIDYLTKKLGKHTQDKEQIDKINLSYFKTYLSVALNDDKVTKDEFSFLNTFVKIFNISEEDSKGRLKKARRYIELRKIEKGNLKKISPSIRLINEADECYYETAVTIYEKIDCENIPGPNRENSLSLFNIKQKGNLFITKTMLQISMRSLHIVHIKDIITPPNIDISHNILELELSGKLGKLYLSTDDNMKVLAIINQLLPE